MKLNKQVLFVISLYTITNLAKSKAKKNKVTHTDSQGFTCCTQTEGGEKK